MLRLFFIALGSGIALASLALLWWHVQHGTAVGFVASFVALTMGIFLILHNHLGE